MVDADFRGNSRRRFTAITILAVTALLVAVIMVVGQARLALALGLESDECERLAEDLEADLVEAQDAGTGRTNSILRSSKARVLDRQCTFVSAEGLADEVID